VTRANSVVASTAAILRSMAVTFPCCSARNQLWLPSPG
jgi:hypothetical protein